MRSPAESRTSLSHDEPTSEQLWKHSRPFRDKKDDRCVSKAGKFRWYRGNKRFRPDVYRAKALFYFTFIQCDIKRGWVNMETIVFVGAGSMAEAIIAGMVVRNTEDAKRIYVMNKSDDDRLDYMQGRYGISIVCPERKALKFADMIVLATKPKDIRQAMAEIAPHLNDHTAALSVIAGTPIKTIEQGLGMRPIARSMPNTSATIGKSASGIAMNSKVDQRCKDQYIQLLSSIGIVKEVREEDLHAVTALSGSGPAYVYYLVEALEEAAIDKGLSKEIARELIIQTLDGAASMLKMTGEDPITLRQNVTSPGGTTEAGLNALETRKFKQTIAECIDSAEGRSRELGALS